MTATFTDGTEAAAREIEQSDAGLFGKQLLKELAAKVRAIQPPDSGGAIVTISTGIESRLTQFKIIYLGIGGFRNPKSLSAKGWAPTDVMFMQLVKRRKHDPEAIVTGTMNYATAMAAGNGDIQFVPAPEAFLNKEWFLKNWAAARLGNGGGGGNLFDVAASLRG